MAKANKKRTFIVNVTRTTEEVQTVEIEASSIDEARELGIEAAEKQDKWSDSYSSCDAEVEG